MRRSHHLVAPARTAAAAPSTLEGEETILGNITGSVKVQNVGLSVMGGQVMAGQGFRQLTPH